MAKLCKFTISFNEGFANQGEINGELARIKDILDINAGNLIHSVVSVVCSESVDINTIPSGDLVIASDTSRPIWNEDSYQEWISIPENVAQVPIWGITDREFYTENILSKHLTERTNV